MKSSPLQTRLVDEVNTAVLRVLSEMGLIAT
jgi:antitoxin component of RelBE/YafQ-DinJ toxin-antitoxin module